MPFPFADHPPEDDEPPDYEIDLEFYSEEEDDHRRELAADAKRDEQDQDGRRRLWRQGTARD